MIKFAKAALLSSASSLLILAGQSMAQPPVEQQLVAAEHHATHSEWDGWGEWGVNLATLDRSVDPGDDFFRYVNGRWLDGFEIPSDQATYGTFMMLRDNSEQDVHAILEDLSGRASNNGLEQLVADYYSSWMNEGAIEARGLAPIAPYQARIDAVQSQADLMQLWAGLHMPSPFAAFVFPDPADTTRYAAGVFQGGLGLPNRDYYLEDDERYVEIRAAYRTYLAALLSAAGRDALDNRVEAILQLETRLADLHWTPAESRDIQRVFNPMSMDELVAYAPEIDWRLILTELGLGDVDTLIVGQDTAIQATARLVAETPLEVWRDYTLAHFINANADGLPGALADARFDLFSRQLSGLQEAPDRWRSGVRLINTGIGEAVGQIYLDRHFPPENRASMDMMVGYVREALGRRLEANPWMDDHTRAGALEKLATFEPRIGYPDEWTDYSALSMDPGQFFENRLQVNELLWNEQVRRLDAEVDRSQWPYPPQTVNASYNPLLNQLTFPAGILQPPFFNAEADMAVNFGGIGATIGHEIGHGFDDQGSQFDAQGRLRNWWTDEARAAFEERTAILVEQYNGFEPLEGMNINGQLTLGENIGDLGGLELAYAAWRIYADEHFPEGAPVIDGFTGDQRFFLAYTQVWRGLRREDSLRRQLLTDPHSPYDARVNGVLRNMNAWYEAFNVSEGDALYLAPEDRVSIW